MPMGDPCAQGASSVFSAKSCLFQGKANLRIAFLSPGFVQPTGERETAQK